MTLDEFVQRGPGFTGRSAWIKEPGFIGIYVRVGPRCINGERIKVIALANFEVIDKGKGVFTRFVKKVEKYQLPIFIENVINPRFAEFLPSLGFVQVQDGGNEIPCFLKTTPGV